MVGRSQIPVIRLKHGRKQQPQTYTIHKNKQDSNFAKHDGANEPNIYNYIKLYIYIYTFVYTHISRFTFIFISIYIHINGYAMILNWDSGLRGSRISLTTSMVSSNLLGLRLRMRCQKGKAMLKDVLRLIS